MAKICLCGSYDDSSKVYEIARELLKNHTVFTPAFYLGRRPSDQSEQTNLMDAHFERIKISDIVVAIFYSKVGANTLMEIGYALALRKKVYTLTEPRIARIPDEFGGYNQIVSRNLTDNLTNLDIFKVGK